MARHAPSSSTAATRRTWSSTSTTRASCGRTRATWEPLWSLPSTGTMGRAGPSAPRQPPPRETTSASSPTSRPWPTTLTSSTTSRSASPSRIPPSWPLAGPTEGCSRPGSARSTPTLLWELLLRVRLCLPLVRGTTPPTGLPSPGTFPPPAAVLRPARTPSGPRGRRSSPAGARLRGGLSLRRSSTCARRSLPPPMSITWRR
mmetsp:Transcript_49771/g.124229  ORF Transcript_49771/g.124229 Transcript_49771/m.124229 type:complete len:202 (-) Transcript_49771:663-1268(-)